MSEKKQYEIEGTESLWLENQICFPLYAVSRMVTKLYTPLLGELDITYPQYLVLLVLWKEGQASVSQICNLLYLESNTLTPLLKRMEKKGLIKRIRSQEDERKVDVELTDEGKAMQQEALCIPQQIVAQMSSEDINLQDIIHLKETLSKLMAMFNNEADFD